ncbi:MAG: FAD-dependent oxidoreductase [Anaerolineaceae bacterium]|jgi:sarcosine oxidase subunit alpha
MSDLRIHSHPILEEATEPSIDFYWKGQKLRARPGEMISSALFANGEKIFGHHPKDNSAQGIFCANGQCSQCLVIVDGLPVKACMTPVTQGIKVSPLDGLPTLPKELPYHQAVFPPTPRIETEVLIIGGGPAGLSAAIELGKLGVNLLLVDDKTRLGGKLVLQTHRFFGSSDAVYAGTRGIDIATKLETEARNFPSNHIWTNSTAVAIFEDRSVGILKDNQSYQLVIPKILLVSSGAREKSLAFPGNTLPGIYGAGAFQTLVNRDLVKPCKNLFIIGGGNVGLIAGYHAIQADINVAGLVEAAPQCGGYKVHLDKLSRSGVPILTSHTVIKANGRDQVESVVIAKVDNHFNPISGTERTIECDTVLIAVGLDPVDEFFKKAKEVGLPVYSAGDAQEIAEASAAIFSGKIVGNEIARALGGLTDDIPQEWINFERVLKSKPGSIHETKLSFEYKDVYPVIHCTQEIPCDPCSNVCPRNFIKIDKQEDIRSIPKFVKPDDKNCIACLRCVAVCPGLAITLVDFRKGNGSALVSLPYEQDISKLKVGQTIDLTDVNGELITSLPIQEIKKVPGFKGTNIITVEAKQEIAVKISGIRLINKAEITDFNSVDDLSEVLSDDAIICRCERITAGEIKRIIRSGVRDINQIKSATKASMGACGGKTCLSMIRRMFVAEGVPLSEITESTQRPVFVEIPISILSNMQNENEGSNHAN